MDRRQFLYSLSSLSAASLSVPCVSSLLPDKRSCTEKYGADLRVRSVGHLNVGIVGVGGPGVLYLDRVAENFNYPCKRIAVARKMVFLRLSSAEDALLLANNGSYPSTIGEARLPAHERRADILRMVSGLDIAFILTNLYSQTDQGLSSVVAEVLREAGVFSVAIKPTGREIEGYGSLKSLVDVGFEVPLNVVRHEDRTQRGSMGRFFCAAMAQICRVVTFSFAKSESPEINATELRSVLRGEGSSAMSYRDGSGAEGALDVFDAACTSPHLGRKGVRDLLGLMVSIEARPGILNDEDTNAVRDRMVSVATKGARLHLTTFENESLRSDCRVTILARG